MVEDSLDGNTAPTKQVASHPEIGPIRVSSSRVSGLRVGQGEEYEAKSSDGFPGVCVFRLVPSQSNRWIRFGACTGG